MWEALDRAIAAKLGRPWRTLSRRAVGGGCINEAVTLEGEGLRFFVKLNRPEFADLFAAEAQALAEISVPGGPRVPQPVTFGTAGDRGFLVLEHLKLGQCGNFEHFGAALARLHRKSAERFGWWRDNAIGATPQANGWCAAWIEFWRRRRLEPQLDLAARRGLPIPQAARLLEDLPRFFTGYRPVPALLHGDLWSGNAAFDEAGAPVIFDPASYYGDRESDLAMTELFGGFPPAFYRGYGQEWPIAAGYEQRRDLYNLYHVLNHFNLFGGDYGVQARALVGQLLGE